MAIDQIASKLGLESLFQDQAAETKKEEDPLGRDAFLKMLIAQMEHQDPLNPMEGSDFSAQLAQFSSLEQLFNMNDHLEGISSAIDGQEKENVMDYIGKQVMIEDDTLRLVDGGISGGLFSLEEPAEIMISIYDDLGREVITLYPGEMAAATHQIDWNGYDRTGKPVLDGIYRFELTAIEESGAYVPIKAAATGLVTSIKNENGVAYLEVDGQLVDPAKVVKVSKSSEVDGKLVDPATLVEVLNPSDSA